MKYKYNIVFKHQGKRDLVNFKSETKMKAYLEKNKEKLNQMDSCQLNFAAISLPLKATTWNIS
jgi:hypothetical protein